MRWIQPALLIFALVAATLAHAQIRRAPSVSGATSPSTGGSVYDSSTTASRNATSSDVDRLTHTVSVLDYGADPTGAADSTGAIQAAIRSLSAAGGTVLFPNGTYIVTPPAASANPAVTLASNVRLEGTGQGSVIKVANRIIGGYSGIFRCVSCSGVVIDSLAIDSNISNNPIANQTEIHTYPREELQLWNCANCQVTHNLFENSSSIDAIDFYNGVQCVISGNMFLNFGDDPNHIAHDMSVIYFGHTFGSGRSSGTISGNIIQAGTFSDAAIAATTGIETHSSNIAVTGNSVWGFANGAFITGIDDITDTDISVVGNSFDVAQAGIGVWSGNNLGAAGYGIDGLTITGNSLRVQQTASSLTGPFAGVLFVDDQTANLPMRNVSIANNSIVFDPPTSGRVTTNSIGIGQAYVDSGMLAQNLSITGNIIDNAPVAGIMFDNTSLENVAIRSNVISDASRSTYSGVNAAYKVPIFLNLSGVATAAGIDVSDNDIVDDSATSLLTYAFYIQFPTTIQQVRFFDNEVNIADTAHADWDGYFDIGAGGSYPLVRMNTLLPWNTAYNFGAGSSVYDQSRSKRYILTAPGSGWQTAPGGIVAQPAPLRAQAANISKTTVYKTPSTDGYYRVCSEEDLTQAASTSSALPLVAISYTSAIDHKVRNSIQGTVDLPRTSNKVDLSNSACSTLYVEGLTNLQFYTVNYASSGAVPMRYAVMITVERVD